MKIIENTTRDLDTFEVPGCVIIGYGITGLIVDERPSPTGIRALETNDFYHEYIANHCSVSLFLDRADCGDELVATGSEANIYGIKALVVRVQAKHEDSENDIEETILLDEEVVIPVFDAFEESNGSVKDFLTRNGILAAMNKLRVLEIQASRKKEAILLKCGQDISALDEEYRESQKALKDKNDDTLAEDMRKLKSSYDVRNRTLRVVKDNECVGVDTAYQKAVKAFLATFSQA